MIGIHLIQRKRRRRGRTLSLLAAMALVATAVQLHDLHGQPAANVPPDNAERLVIVVESVRGTVYNTRPGQPRQRITINSRLTQGDRIHANPGAICKLVFQRPRTGETLSATIIRGYSDIRLTLAIQQGAATRTLLDVRQGVIRAGVVRTAVPPSFRIRTPRSVVAVRGTEIAELEASNDRGDSLQMGVVGTVTVNDSVPLFRSVQPMQGTLKRTEKDRRGGKLLRAIENAILRPSRLIAGPHRRGFEVDFARNSLFSRPFAFNSGDFQKSEGNPGYGRIVNSRGRLDLRNLNPFANQPPINQPPRINRRESTALQSTALQSKPMSP